MSKLKSRTYSPGPSTTQSGVLNYAALQAKDNRRRRYKQVRKVMHDNALAHHRDAIRQEVDADNGVNFDAVAHILKRNPRMTLREAKRLSEGI